MSPPHLSSGERGEERGKRRKRGGKGEREEKRGKERRKGGGEKEKRGRGEEKGRRRGKMLCSMRKLLKNRRKLVKKAYFVTHAQIRLGVLSQEPFKLDKK